MGFITEKALDSQLRSRLGNADIQYALLFDSKSKNNNDTEIVDCADYTYEHNFGQATSIVQQSSNPIISFINDADLGDNCSFTFNSTGLYEIDFKTNVWGTEKSCFNLVSYTALKNGDDPNQATYAKFTNHFEQDIGILLPHKLDSSNYMFASWDVEGYDCQGFNKTVWKPFSGKIIAEINSTSEEFINQLLFFNTAYLKANDGSISGAYLYKSPQFGNQIPDVASEPFYPSYQYYENSSTYISSTDIDNANNMNLEGISYLDNSFITILIKKIG